MKGAVFDFTRFISIRLRGVCALPLSIIPCSGLGVGDADLEVLGKTRVSRRPWSASTVRWRDILMSAKSRSCAWRRGDSVGRLRKAGAAPAAFRHEPAVHHDHCRQPDRGLCASRFLAAPPPYSRRCRRLVLNQFRNGLDIDGYDDEPAIHFAPAPGIQARFP